MKRIAWMLLLLPIFLSGCVGAFNWGSVAKSKAVGGMPPEIDPKLPKTESTTAADPKPETTPPKVIRTSAKQPMVPDAGKQAFSGPITADQVTPENAHAMLDALEREMSPFETR